MAAVVAAGHPAAGGGHDYPGEIEPMLEGSPAKPFEDTLVAEQQDFQTLVLACNKEGMDFLRRGQHKQAFERLKYAEAVLASSQGEEEPSSLLAVTCNNLGCYYKKVGKVHAALSYLRKALKIEVSLQTDDVTVAGTHLNICAILSKLEKHDKAVQHALCALDLISNRVSTSPSASQDEYSVLAIAYHNVAVERDYLHQWDQAAEAYQQGYQIARKCLGEHPLTQTLAKNCESAMQKSRKSAGLPSKAPGVFPTVTTKSGGADKLAEKADSGGGAGLVHDTASVAGGGGRELSSHAPLLPDIGASRHKEPQAHEDPMPIPSGSVLQEAADWVQASSMTAQRGPLLAPGARHGATSAAYISNQSEITMGETTENQWTAYPSYQASPPPLQMMSQNAPAVVRSAKEERVRTSLRGPSEESLQLGPQDQGSTAVPRSKPAERPPSVQKAPSSDGLMPTLPPGPPPTSAVATTRAQRMAARREAALRNKGGSDAGSVQLESQIQRKNAALKIQRAWREYCEYKQENGERIALEHKSATKIQATWRSFHVRHVRRTRAAVVIQKWARGYLVRRWRHRERAAVVIQRQARGLLARRRMRQLDAAAIAIQKKARQQQAARAAAAHRQAVDASTRLIQRCMRGWSARNLARGLRQQKQAQQRRDEAATRIQSLVRGRQARRRARERRAEYLKDMAENQAAIKLQAIIRRDQAQKRAEDLRIARLDTMNRAATIIRKYWLRCLYRRRYLELRKEFRQHEDSVVTIQRYVRGFLVRVRMWRNAIKVEEELWASVEIQRVWRGYMGRLKWELAYEAKWTREVAVERLQRYIRGWLARTRVHRLRQRRARAEFEKARRRFKAAQRIQARIRGWHARKRLAARRHRLDTAAAEIQRVWRGHRARCRLWEEVRLRSVVRLQAAARGFLVRLRRLHFIAKIIHIQRFYRARLYGLPKEERDRRRERWRARHRQAVSPAGATASADAQEAP